ncbi:MAG: PIN domain-containing protein [Deltaproteobacteria bacterium]
MIKSYKDYIFVDTSAWYALFDKDDNNHAQANHFYENNIFPLVTTDYILDEALTLTKKRLGHTKAIEIGKPLWNQELADLIHLIEEDKATAWRIFQRYDDKGFSFTDCTTFAIMERLNIPTVFAFDVHFKQYPRLESLP